MAHVWTFDETAPSGWVARPLVGATTVLDVVELERSSSADGERWVLFASAETRVNGVPLPAGIAVLRDRDEVRAGDHRVFFTTETLAEVAPQPAGEPVFCPRCKLEIEAGSPAVRCPGCRVAHHQSERFPCWRYSERCATCDHPTALDADFRWTPEEL